MPNGVPVATVALNAAKNAGILAAQIIGTSNADVADALQRYKEKLNSSVQEKIKKLSADFPNGFDKGL
jgi:5-(carboxyamino)imidazole ribonucleotide mutase